MNSLHRLSEAAESFQITPVLPPNNLSEISIYPNITLNFIFSLYLSYIYMIFNLLLYFNSNRTKEKLLYMKLCKCKWHHNFFLSVYFYKF